MTHSNKPSFAALFQAARIMVGLNQVQVAVFIDVSQSCLSKIESAVLDPGAEEYNKFKALVLSRAPSDPIRRIVQTLFGAFESEFSIAVVSKKGVPTWSWETKELQS